MRLTLGIVLLSLISTSTVFATSGKGFTCKEAKPSQEQRTVVGTIASATQLLNVQQNFVQNGHLYSNGYNMMQGVSDPWELSPQTGQRFYFHTGNTSEFLLLSEDVLQSVLDSKLAVTFTAQDIWEEYENGGFQSLTEMVCTTL